MIKNNEKEKTKKPQKNKKISQVDESKQCNVNNLPEQYFLI